MLPKIIKKLKSLEVKGSRYGLQRVRTLLDLLGSPDDSVKIVHVAGTNGKGSLCAYLTAGLLKDGKTVGTFTSPQVYCYEEKFLLNGDPAPYRLLKKYLKQVWRVAESMEDRPTAFEREVALAFLLFQKCGVEYAVVECGLGGLSDATNAIHKKELAVISSVSLEHTALLGNTVTEICHQKAGIIKDCPVVVNPLQSAEGLAYFGHISGCILPEAPQNVQDGRFTYQNSSYAVSLHGTAQAYNAVTAIESLRHLNVSQSAIAQGLASATLLGRVEVIKAKGKTYILDGSHNPAAFAPLVDFTSSQKLSPQVVFGCLSDKDASAVAKQLSLITKSVVIVPPPSYRAMSQQAMVKALTPHIPTVTTAPSVKRALKSAQANVVVVCGTFTILKEAKSWIAKRQ